jgi:hypothetical protein
MQNKKCIIKEMPNYGPMPADGEIVIAKLLEESRPRQMLQVRYQNTLTGDIYLCLSGGFAWPVNSVSGSSDAVTPGFVFVVAVMEHPEDNDKVVYKVLAEVEQHGATALIADADALFHTYGANCGILPWSWQGDPDDENRMFLDAFNQQNNRYGENNYFYLSSPPNSKNKQAYPELVRSLLVPDNKVLFIGKESNLPNYMLNNTNRQAIVALGYVLDYFQTVQPWLRDLSPSDGTEEMDEDEWVY